MTAVLVGLAPAGADRLVRALDDLVLTGAVEVGERRGGVGAVRVEEGPPGQRRAGRGFERVGDLTERTGIGARSGSRGRLQVADCDPRLDPGCRMGVRGRIDDRSEPFAVACRTVGLVPPGVRVGVVAAADQHGVVRAGTGEDRGGRVDRATLVGHTWAARDRPSFRDGRSSGRGPRGRVAEMEGVEVSRAIADDGRGLSVQICHAR